MCRPCPDKRLKVVKGRALLRLTSLRGRILRFRMKGLG